MKTTSEILDFCRRAADERHDLLNNPANVETVRRLVGEISAYEAVLAFAVKREPSHKPG